MRGTIPALAIIIFLSAGCGGENQDNQLPVETTPDMAGQYSAIYRSDSSSGTIPGIADLAPAGGNWEFTVSQEGKDISVTMKSGMVLRGQVSQSLPRTCSQTH